MWLISFRKYENEKIISKTSRCLRLVKLRGNTVCCSRFQRTQSGGLLRFILSGLRSHNLWKSWHTVFSGRFPF